MKTRPTYLTSVISHGVYSLSPFSSIHAGLGTISIGRVAPTQLGEVCKNDHNPCDMANPQDLIEQITKSPVLAATEISPTELVQARLEKLVVNAMINPLSVIFNRKNGQLFNHTAIAYLMQILLSETSAVVRSLPELASVPNLDSRFSASRLENIVRHVAEGTAKNTSSMLQDIMAGRETEIDYINGYIIRKGEQLGIHCPHNRRIVQMVKDKTLIDEDQIEGLFPSIISE